MLQMVSNLNQTVTNLLSKFVQEANHESQQLFEQSFDLTFLQLFCSRTSLAFARESVAPWCGLQKFKHLLRLKLNEPLINVARASADFSILQ